MVISIQVNQLDKERKAAHKNYSSQINYHEQASINEEQMTGSCLSSSSRDKLPFVFVQMT